MSRFVCCVVSRFGGSMVADFLWLLWQLLGDSCYGQSYAVVFWLVFGPSGNGVVGFELGLILSYVFDSHYGCGCSV